jgi:hypothetical protein
MNQHPYLVQPYEQFMATMKQFLEENKISESKFLAPKSNRIN